jgi:hypothetical protein
MGGNLKKIWSGSADKSARLPSLDVVEKAGSSVWRLT